MRIGLAEVGSSAVRTSVLDFRTQSEFQIIDTSTAPHDIGLRSQNSDDLVRLVNLIDAARARIAGQNCDRTIIYGTELCRGIRENGRVLPDDLIILTPEMEATASWSAGVLTAVQTGSRSGRYTVLDVGTGSTELVTATWDGKSIRDIDAKSFPYGSRRLSEIYGEAGPGDCVTAIQALIHNSLGKGSDDRLAPGARLLVLGGAPTKIAWMKVRRFVSEEYKARRVDGVRISAAELLASFKALRTEYERNPDAARILVDGRVQDLSEVRAVLSASIYLLLMCSIRKHSSFTVSGYGTRYGIAFLSRAGVNLTA